jgi:predicted small lipoprotein YifL
MRAVLAAVAAVALLTGCGQKGPLYLPDKKPAAVTAPAPQPAPPGSTRKPGDNGDRPPPQ